MTYDGHGRPIQIGFGATTAAPTTYASTIKLTWDKGDRLTQIVDSAYGTITHEYDGLDRLIKETSPQGQVSYTYDAAGRRKTMTVLGQPKLTYTYDNADRLTQIVQDAGPSNNNIAQTIKFSYDNDNRRTQVTLANGTKINTTYDNADQITAISYTKADGTSLGNLTYSYDGKGRRTGVGGTLTSTELPTAVTDPLYDANNRLTRWNGKTFQYDANGNLINDGERSYGWNARDELQGLGGTQSASFRYDPMGRRSAKTISTTTTGYLYDGMDFVQELAGTTSTSGVRANLITGSLDEPLLRITGSGSTATLSHFFSDANNNVIALTDSTQAIATKYSYGAYGQSKQTTVSGATNTNSQQYTGRENDGTGLLYYRARYYHVGCARFISEDPIGWASGQTNGYAYVGGDPVNNTDPLGEFAVAGALVGAGIDLAVQLIANGGNLGCVSLSSIAVSAALGAVGAVGWSKLADRGLRLGMSRANSAFPKGIERVERSHFWPNKWGGSFNEHNIKMMWGSEHALADAARYRFLPRWWKSENPLPNPVSRLWNRTPDWIKGGGGGGALGTAVGPSESGSCP